MKRVLPAAGLLALIALAASLAGCGKSATSTKPDGQKSEAAKADPWDGVAKRLRKDTDVGACRAALNQLNSDLGNRPDVPGPAPLSPDAEKALAALVPLAGPDAAEIRSASFSNLDPVYLADCLYLRDAAQSLEVPGASPEKHADLAFAWVCRQVLLQPWLMDGRLVPAVPPAFVLRRGSGSGLERAYVFLVVLQQLGLDGCLIGRPDAATQPTGFAPPGGTPTNGVIIPKGPFWAVGVRAGADVLLYDPWRGEKFPGTLAKLKTNPDPLKPWFEAKSPAWDVTADDVKNASVFLAVPVSGLSPRAAMLEDKLKADSGVKLSVNASALRERFLTEALKGPAFPNADAKFWNPPADRFAYGRVTATFMPFDEGGLDRAESTARIHTMYHFALLPRSVLMLPRELTEAPVKERLMSIAAATYERAFHAPPSPRERIQRGQFQDAARYLAEKQDAFTKGLERLRNNRDSESIAAWCKQASEVFADISRAESFNPAAVPEAQQAAAAFWQRHGGTAQLVVDLASARAGMVEATFLIALLKHEEAERHQARREHAGGDSLKADAVNAWKEAANAWGSYLDTTKNDAAFAPRAAYVKALADRAEALAK